MAAIHPLEHQSETLSRLHAQVDKLGKTFETRRGDATANRRLPVANVREMQAAGLFRVYNPARFGGHELHMQDVLPLVAKIAEHCAASAWVLAVYQIHCWVVSLMSDQAQQEVFGGNTDPIVPASLNPSKNTARKVDGGYLIEKGQFTFCSGGAVRDWTMGGALIMDAAGKVADVGCLLIPGTDVKDKDDWYVAGLQGTGSISLVAENVFVPAHRFLSYSDGCGYTAPGSKVNTGSLYQTAFVPMLVLNLAGPALGIAERALAEFIANLREKGQKAGSYPLAGVTRVDAPACHEAIADARLKIDTAWLFCERAGRLIREAGEAGRTLTREQSARINLDVSYAMRQCMEAVKTLFLQSGGAVLMPHHPLQQALQDVMAVNVHGFLGHEANVSLYGSLVTGHEHPTAFL